MTTYAQARDDIQALFWAAWSSAAPAQNSGAVPDVRWQWLDSPAASPDLTKPWARVTIRHNDGGQSTFGPAGQRRFTKTGEVFVQVFAPINKAGATQLENLATIAQDAFEGKTTTNGVLFRKVVAREGETYQGWNQVTVVASFTYDDVK